MSKVPPVASDGVMTYEPAFVFTGTEDESPTFNVTEPMV